MFDMKADPQIRRNLAGKMPDVANRFHRKIERFMKAQNIEDAMVKSFVPVR